MPTATRYANWKAPAADGQVVLWPEPPDLLAQSRDNHRQLAAADDVRVQNAPLPELRRQMRQWIGHRDDEQLLVATGHQTELYHPGVWAKHAAVNAIAAPLGAAAYFVAVDTDSPKHLTLKWPDREAAHVGGASPVTDDPGVTSAEWSGQLELPTPKHLEVVREDLTAAAGGWGFEPSTEPFFSTLRRLQLDPVPLSAGITNAMHAVDWSLGLRHHALLASPMFDAPPYLALVYHVCARAERFAADYNAALAEYRREAEITNPGRPMPDLKATDAACEVPFWLDELATGGRERATVVRVDGRWTIVRADDAFAFDPSLDGFEAAGRLAAWLRRGGRRLSPRALTLTMFLRLLLCDQFVHGIGGGRYDQVLDKLLARHFALDPPRFSVTTATLFFPHAATASRACVPCTVHEGHQLRHRVLGERKMQLVSAIDAAPRRSNQRARLFAEMHNELAGHARHPALLDWERRLADTRAEEERQRVIFDRELFYALQPADRLTQLVDRYAAAFGGGVRR
ncbi:MAG TPA: hypothetical protein VK324_03770 [Tepidisphaeraceae bacterium]|nr:hypothetical protein [Tepidisphaeraceae bacterium]